MLIRVLPCALAMAARGQSLPVTTQATDVSAEEALVHLQLQEWDEAERDYRQLLNTEPNNAMYRYSHGVALTGLKRTAEARAEFLAAATLDPALSPATEALATINNATAATLRLSPRLPTEKPWSVSLVLGANYDSNVSQAGTQRAIPNSISGESDFTFFCQANAGYRWVLNDRTEVGITTENYFSRQVELDDFDTISLQISPYWRYALSADAMLVLSNHLNYIALGGESFLWRDALDAQTTFIHGEEASTTVSTRLEYDGFTEDDFGPLDRTGWAFGVGLSERLILWARDDAFSTLDLAYRLTRLETEGSDFDGTLHDFSATLACPVPQWKLNLVGAVGFEIADYSEANSLDRSGTRERFDTAWNFTLQAERELTTAWKVGTSYSYTTNASNIAQLDGSEPYDFDRHVVSVYARYDW